MRKALQFFSALLSTFACSLCLLGVWGMTRFYEYKTMPDDPRMPWFENGFYPYMWGLLFMTLGVLLRLRWHRYAWVPSGVCGLVVSCWMLWTHPGETPGVALFPEVEVLQLLAASSVVMLVLAAGETYLYRRKKNAR